MCGLRDQEKAHALGSILVALNVDVGVAEVGRVVVVAEMDVHRSVSKTPRGEDGGDLHAAADRQEGMGGRKRRFRC